MSLLETISAARACSWARVACELGPQSFVVAEPNSIRMKRFIAYLGTSAGERPAFNANTRTGGAKKWSAEGRRRGGAWASSVLERADVLHPAEPGGDVAHGDVESGEEQLRHEEGGPGLVGDLGIGGEAADEESGRCGRHACGRPSAVPIRGHRHWWLVIVGGNPLTSVAAIVGGRLSHRRPRR